MERPDAVLQRPPAAAIVDRNCFSVSLYSAQKPGDVAFIRVASYYPVTMFSQCERWRVAHRKRSIASSTWCRAISIAILSPAACRSVASRCLWPSPFRMAPATPERSSKPSWPGRITYSGTLLRQTLANEPGTVLATSQSAPLHDLLRIMLKKSDNMIADTVFRTIGHARFGVPAPAGSDAVRQILRQQAGVDLGNTIIADGSGLSRHNLIAPATMMQVLQYIAQHDTELNFISTLPLAAATDRCSIAPVFIRRASMVKFRRKPGRSRGFTTSQASSLPPADKGGLRAISPATPWSQLISAIAASHWSALKAACIKICTTINKRAASDAALLIQRSQD